VWEIVGNSQNRKQSSLSGNRVPFPAGRSDSDSQNRKQSSVSGNIVPSPAGRSDPDSQIGKQSSVSRNRVPYPDGEDAMMGAMMGPLHWNIVSLLASLPGRWKYYNTMTVHGSRRT
jgi:hypothetical protein